MKCMTQVLLDMIYLSQRQNNNNNNNNKNNNNKDKIQKYRSK